MAHEIDTYSIGRASYASTGREWHGLGELMQPGQTVEQWQAAAGMNYKVKRAFVRYATQRPDDDTPQAQARLIEGMRTINDRVVLFRSDTGADLGIVSDSYKIVQPSDVLEFFCEWADMGGLTIESAGVLFGGRRYFATAKLADGVSVGGNDRVVPYALLSTSADGSLATECRWTTVRTVCNNTLTMARGGSKACHKTSHRSVFRPSEARAAVEAAHEEFSAFMQCARALADVRVSSQRAQDLTAQLLTTGARDTDAARESAGFARILALFSGAGKGAMLDTARGTAWGWLNAVTDYVDHDVRARTEEGRTASALWGAGDALKGRALDLVSL
jgi:phage/plasmid-like protein (TIGR03299 family)